VGFAPLGADAVEGIVAKFVRNLVANMADRHDLAIDVDAALVASALRPPETQAWDGRYVKEELERVLVRPLRRQRMLLAPPRGSRCAVEVGPDGICRLEVVGAVASAV
jgi:ATP-dependent Clp protease ATP-binding subunit ClpA